MILELCIQVITILLVCPTIYRVPAPLLTGDKRES